MKALARVLARPAVVALLFAPIALMLWGLQLGLFGLQGSARVQAFEIVQLVMLVSGGVFYWVACRADAAPPHGARNAGAALALIAAAVAISAQFAAADAHLNAAIGPVAALASLANLVLVAGFAEELWFRGLWTRAARTSLVLAVGWGALAFGLLHWPMGPGRVATTAALGLLYGAARWRGAPIWALALAHGAVNWIGSTVAPAATWRFGALPSQALFCLIVLAAVWIVLRRGLPMEDTR
jgi:membrane protease YdiL (CAAX protease family)